MLNVQRMLRTGLLAAGILAAPFAAEADVAGLLQQGGNQLRDGAYLEARKSFRAVLEEDDENLDALEGLALASLAIEDWNDGFDAVHDGIKYSRKKADQRRFKTIEIDMETAEAKWGWYLRAYNIYHRHLQEDPKGWSDSDFALAIAKSALAGFKREEDERYLDEAVRYLRRAVSSGGKAGGEAAPLLAQVEGVYRASLGNERLARLALDNTISRADIIELIYNQMKLTKLLPPSKGSKGRPGETASDGSTDFEKHPLAQSIRDLHRRDLRGLYITDGNFRPEDPISREEFALLLEDLIVAKAENRALARKFIGAPSPFDDLQPSRFSFNAFMTATSRGLLHADSKGLIHPTEPISGADAILALRTLSGQDLVPAN